MFTLLDLESAQTLHSIVLNTGITCEPPRDYFESAPAKFRALAAHHGGILRSSYGDCELRIDCADDHSILAVKCDDQPAGLAALVWSDFGADIIWHELLKRHRKMLRNVHYPVELLTKAPPESLPWIAVSFLPGFIVNSPPLKVACALSAMWSAAYGVLAEQEHSWFNN